MFQVPRQVLQECSDSPSPMVCKPSLFSSLDFKPTADEGAFDILSDSEKFVVVIRPDDFLCVLFYQRAFSNFDACPIPMRVGDVLIHPPCGEAAFKMACAATFGDWEVFKKAYLAETPKACKQTSRAIASFVPSQWDAQAPEAMARVQRWKVQNPATFDFMKTIQGVAEAAAVPLDRVYFFESTSNDCIWGTGVDTHPLKDRILSSPTPPDFDSLHPEGKNQLGKALTAVFRELAPCATPEEYAESMPDEARSLFSVAEECAESMPDEASSQLSAADSIGRTLS